LSAFKIVRILFFIHFLLSDLTDFVPKLFIGRVQINDFIIVSLIPLQVLLSFFNKFIINVVISEFLIGFADFLIN